MFCFSKFLRKSEIPCSRWALNLKISGCSEMRDRRFLVGAVCGI